MGFHTEFCENHELRILRIFKIGLSHRVKELLKSNQTWYGVSPVSVECKTKKNYGMACLGKKLSFQAEIFEFCEERILTIVISAWVKKLFKLNQTWYGVSPV